MANKSLKKNFIYNLIYQVTMLVSPLVVTPYISRIFLPESIGLYSYADSMAAYFVLVAVLGTSTYGQRAIGYLQEDKEGRSRAFWEIFLLRFMTTSVTLAAYAVYALLFARENIVVTVILALNVLNVVFDISWFMQGLEEFGKTAFRSILFRLLSVGAIFLFVKNDGDLYLYVLFMTAFTVLGNLSLWLYLPKYLVRVKGIRPFHDIRSVLMLFLPTVATQVYTVLDKSMLGWFSDGYNENGYYEQAEKIVKIALSAVTALGIVMIPRIASTYKAGDTERVRYYIYNSYRYVWMAAIPLMLGFISIASVFTPVYYGEGYGKCAVLLPIFSILLVMIGLSNVNGMQYFVPIGKENILTLTVVVGAVVNFAMNLILIPFLASVGAAIASVVAEFAVTLTGFLYIWRTKQFPLGPVFLCSWRYWLAGGAMCGVLFGVKYFLPVTLWSLILLIGMGAAVYFVVLLLLRDPFLFDLIKKSLAMLGLRREREEKVDAPDAPEEQAEEDQEQDGQDERNETEKN